MQDFKHIDWEKFHFLRAEYLWVGIPILLCVLLGIFFFKEKVVWKKHISKELQPYVIQKGTEWKSRAIHISLIILFGLAYLAFLGPTWSEVKAPAKKLESKLVIALDLSQSMLTHDVSPNRLERAKFKIIDFLTANPRAETALLAYSGTTHTVVPFTTDYKIILDQLDGLKPSMMPVRGTGYDVLFETLDSLFTDNKAQGRILIATDDLNGIHPKNVSAFMQENNVDLQVYPFATESGGEIPSFYNAKYALKEKGKTIPTALNDTIAKQLQTLENVNILTVTLDNSDVKQLAKEISKNLIFTEAPKKEENNWQDNGYFLLIPLALLFIFSFRKGLAIYVFIVFIGLSSCTKEKKDTKSKKDDFAFKDLWYTKPYQGQKEYDNKDYAQAAKDFKDPLRKGTAYFKMGDYQSARAAFEKDTSATAKYNLGLTYAKLGDLNKSKQIFQEIVSRDSTNNDAKNNLLKVSHVMQSLDTVKTKKVPKQEKGLAKNRENKSQEDLGGGGQKATKKDMEKSRLEEEVSTGKRIGKESDEVPDNFKSGKGQIPNNILMRKVDDDPALFLTKKFRYQVKKDKVIKKEAPTSW